MCVVCGCRGVCGVIESVGVGRVCVACAGSCSHLLRCSEAFSPPHVVSFNKSFLIKLVRVW